MPLGVPAVVDAGRRGDGPPPRGSAHLVRAGRWAPGALLAVLAVAFLVRHGVAATDVVRYALYWLVAVQLPGLVVSRATIGVRETVVEDLALGSVTGISLEVLSWVVGVSTGLGSAVRFWWVPVVVAGAAVPGLRRRVLVRVPERVPTAHALGLVALVALVLERFGVGSLVFRAPLPPAGATTYVDMWWQLSLVQEMMRYQPPQVPQVAGVPFHYHWFANVQIASGARLSGVAPEVVAFRLWYVPVTLVSIGVAVALGRAVTRSLSGGVAAAAVVYGLTTTSYLWPGTLGSIAASPMPSTSPSQLLANVGLGACAVGAVLLLRGRPSRPAVAWVVLVVLGASGDKSTLVPLLLAGTVVALLRAVVTRSWTAARGLAVAAGALLALEAVIAHVAAATAGGRITLLGPLRFLPVFSELVPSTGLRARNHGLVLDAITSPRTVLVAAFATVVVLGFHTVRLAGVVGLARRANRGSLAHWWLAGGAVTGYAVMLCLDHVALSQVFFGMAGGLLSAALTVGTLWTALGRLRDGRRALVGWGLLAGGGVALLVDAVVEGRRPGRGVVEQVVLPLAVVAVVAVACCAATWWRLRAARPGAAGCRTGDVAWVLALAAVLGAAVPSTVGEVVSAARERPGRTAADAPRVTRAEQEAALWLRAHSGIDDVVATDAYCLDVVTTPHCSARGFWVSGLSGRRVVLEGWAYTDQAQAEQGVGGRPYDEQPSPFRRRFGLDEAVFDRSDRAALATLRRRYHVRWLVAVHRAGPTPVFPASVARVRFDDGAVTILAVR